VTHRLFENLEIDWARLCGPPVPAPAAARDPILEPGRLTLRSFMSEDLSSARSLLALHREAISRRYLTNSEADLIGFLSRARCCLRLGRNPAALFRYLIDRGHLVASYEDEDRAYQAFKKFRRENQESAVFLKTKSPAGPPEPNSTFSHAANPSGNSNRERNFQE
jgi:hypothetical protein